MIIYSSHINVNESFNKSVFSQMVRQWNQKSPYDKIAMGEISDEFNFKCVDGTKSLEVIDFEEDGRIAARFKKEDEQQIVWTVDLIYNYSKQELLVCLFRGISQFAEKVSTNIKPPYFMKMIIDGEYSGLDNGLPVNNKIYTINHDNIHIISDVINGNTVYDLPIVYITRKSSGECCVEVEKLAYLMQGVGHVLVEESADISFELRKLCNSENVHHGGIGIYYPNLGTACTKINPVHYDDPKAISKRILKIVYRIMNSQLQEDLDTWSGLIEARLKRKYKEISANHNEAVISNEILKGIIEEYEEALNNLKSRCKELEKENSRLKKADFSNREEAVIEGKAEQEFFEGEHSTFVIECVKAYLRSLPPNTQSRKADVLNDIVNSDIAIADLKKKKEHLKKLLKGYKCMTNSLRRGLEALGFVITEEGKHYKLKYYNDDRYTFTMAKSCSDNRGGANLASDIAKKIW